MRIENMTMAKLERDRDQLKLELKAIEKEIEKRIKKSGPHAYGIMAYCGHNRLGGILGPTTDLKKLEDYKPTEEEIPKPGYLAIVDLTEDVVLYYWDCDSEKWIWQVSIKK